MQPAHDYTPAPEDEDPADIYAAYLVHLQRRRRGNTAYTQAARSFLQRWPQVQRWAGLPLDTRLAANCSTRPFITFLMVSRRGGRRSNAGLTCRSTPGWPRTARPARSSPS